MLGVIASVIPKNTACIVVIGAPQRGLRIYRLHPERASSALLVSIGTRRPPDYYGSVEIDRQKQSTPFRALP
jgi:hypothetical protein